jgi:hypothetical protein
MFEPLMTAAELENQPEYIITVGISCEVILRTLVQAEACEHMDSIRYSGGHATLWVSLQNA